MKANLALVVVLTGILIGCYNYSSKNVEMFLHVPKIGFIPYLLLGGPVPPFMDYYSLSTCYDEENCPWLNDGDVVIDVCAKCGTNWMSTVVHELRTLNLTDDQKDFNHLGEIAPFVEMMLFPGMKGKFKYLEWAIGWNRTEFPFKQFVTHIPPHKINEKGVKETLVPARERPGVKFLVVVRNPLDEMLSAYEFLQKGNPEHIAQFGGFPGFQLSLEDYVSFAQSSSFGLGLAPEFFKAWQEYKDLDNVLILHYADIFKNQEKFIREIAQFVGIDLPENKVKDILHRTSIGFMKERNHKYNLYAGKNRDIKILLEDALINKGGIGRGKAVDQVLQKNLDDYVEAVLPNPHDRKLLAEGFGGKRLS